MAPREMTPSHAEVERENERLRRIIAEAASLLHAGFGKGARLVNRSARDARVLLAEALDGKALPARKRVSLEVLHHIDGDPTNNRPNNIAIVQANENRREWIECPVCDLGHYAGDGCYPVKHERGER